ncbi:Zinc finger protein [Oopsacas minuta]|uniref:Zinc finger protein n=1 Tax=Oopsacas minuta TaxID=111878 RepID=A0AAV7K9D9_9METZ|nr:Zinc finger protein [Oopsacas minuta]
MPNLRRVKYDCVRCYGFRTKTADDMITHFRIKHGIKPETFSAKKRKAFYDYFKLSDDEYTRDTDEEREDPDYYGEEMDTTILEGDLDPCNFSPLEVTESTPDVINNIDRDILSTEIQIPEEGTYNLTSSIEVTDFINNATGNIDEVSTDLKIPDEGTGPYFCPYCGKGMGWYYPTLKRHLTVYNKSCEKMKFYTCQDCKTGYTLLKTLIQHQKQYHDICADMQKQKEKERLQMKKREMETNSLYDNHDPLPLSVEIPKQGSGPYYCPYCQKGVGYYYPALKRHFARYNKSCKKQRYYLCGCCKTGFISPYGLRYHEKKYNSRCAEIQKNRSQRCEL